MSVVRRGVCAGLVSIAMAVGVAASATGAGAATAAPTTAAQPASVDIASQWLFFSDPYPFGVGTIRVSRVAPGVLTMAAADYCTPPYVPRPSCTGGPIEIAADVAWISLSTGASGTVRVSPLAKPVTVATGRGLIALAGRLEQFGLPGGATIQA